MFLLALITFGVVIVALRQRVRNTNKIHRTIAIIAMIVALVGLTVFARVAVIDIITGLRAANNAAMGGISDRLNAYPSASLVPYYNFGPLLFQLGFLVLMLQLVIIKPRQLPWWSPILLFAGFLMLGLDLNLLIPGAVVIGIALSSLLFKKELSRLNQS